MTIYNPPRPCAVEGCPHHCVPNFGRCEQHAPLDTSRLADGPFCDSCGSQLVDSDGHGARLCWRCAEAKGPDYAARLSNGAGFTAKAQMWFSQIWGVKK